MSFIGTSLTAIVITGTAFVCLWLVAGDAGAPGGNLFSIGILFITSSLFGMALDKLQIGLPPLLGMLVAGFLLRNLPFVGDHVGARIDPIWSKEIRTICLTLILCRAGLGMDLKALKEMKFIVARLAVLPCMAEALTTMVLARVLLAFPWAWSLMLGFVVAAISPAVVVPSLMDLQERGYGKAAGIPALVVASAAIDVVLCIAGFGICLSFAIQTQDDAPLWFDIIRAPLELALGLGAGLLGAGVVTVVLQAHKDETQQSLRIPVLLLLCFTSSLSLKKSGFSGASALSVLILAVAAAQKWEPRTSKEVSATLARFWNVVAQPTLFALVASSVSVSQLKGDTIVKGLIILACGLTVRCTVAFLAVSGPRLQKKERLFTALAWIPKATVQAALGAVALDEARSEVHLDMGHDVLAICLLAILVAAPIGAAIVAITGPRLLTSQEAEQGLSVSKSCEASASNLISVA